MRRQNVQFANCIASGLALALLLAFWTTTACAQGADVSPKSDDANQANQTADDPIITMFPHSQTARYWISGQDNIIFQYHPSFYAKYNGPNSFTPGANNSTSNVSTLFLGYQLR